MDTTIFMNSENSKTFETHRQLLNLLYKIKLKRSDEYVAINMEKYKKSHKKQ